MDKNQTWARLFAYSTGVLMIGALYYVATYKFYVFLEETSLTSIIAWIFFILTIGNASFFLIKRYRRKSTSSEIMAYFLAILFLMPIFIQLILRTESGLIENRPLFFAVLTLSSLLGSFIANKKMQTIDTK